MIVYAFISNTYSDAMIGFASKHDMPEELTQGDYSMRGWLAIGGINRAALCGRPFR